MLISFFSVDISSLPLKNRKSVREVLNHLFKEERKELKSLTIIFSSDMYLLAMNMKFLRHNFYTDVITFNLSNNSDEIDGEIYISISRVRENATYERVTVQDELRRVILHGALHLCGYKDKTKSEKAIMRVLENKYLRYFQQ